jgi:hypothetical protein
VSANDRQEGGDHYRKVEGEQHWDRLVRLYGLEKARCYFIGNLTAYVERYMEKDGVKDLKKARHYLDKLIELESDSKLEGSLSHIPVRVNQALQGCPIDEEIARRIADNVEQQILGTKPAVEIVVTNEQGDCP